MKLFTFAIVAVMLFATIATAAEVPTSEGDKAMVFMFNGLDNLGVDGYGGYYGIGMRFYIADMTAIRGGVQFGKWSEVDKADMEGYADWEENYTLYGLNAIYEKHMEGPCASISPYWGIGAAIEMESDEVIEPTGADGGTYTSTDKGTGFAGFGVLGFEWGFANCMSLGGEYQLGFWSWSGKTEYDSSGGDRTETVDEYTNTFLGFSTASVFLSVYF